jgi:glycosyltransferase involved in cell wall biosynthesis
MIHSEKTGRSILNYNSSPEACPVRRGRMSDRLKFLVKVGQYYAARLVDGIDRLVLKGSPSRAESRVQNAEKLESNLSSVPRPRVVMFMREFYPLTGGYQNQALRLAQAMIERHVGVKVVTHRQGRLPRHEVYNRIPIQRVSALQKGHLAAFSFLAASLLWMARNRHSFEIIHANRSSSGLIAGLIGLLLRKKVLYKLTRGDEIDIKGFRSTLWGSLKLRYLLRTVHKFVAITREIEEDLKHLGVSSARIVRIPNGISLEPRFRPADAQQVKAQLGWSSDVQIVTFVGRLVHAKGVDWLLEVWKEIAGQEKNARLLIIGEGPDRSALETTAQELGISSTVAFLGAQKDVWQFLDATDVFALPSRREGISNALLEAMSLGLAVIVADDSLGGNREIVQHGDNGCVVAFGDTKTYAETLVRLLRHSELRSDIGKRARQSIEQTFSIDSVADRYLKTYFALLDSPTSTGAVKEKLSVGLFLARPDRSRHMAVKLRERGLAVVHYNTESDGESGWIRVRKGFMPALQHILFRTDHDVYFAALSFVPSLSVCFNRLLRRKPYIFNATGVKSEMYKDRSRGKPFARLFERYFYPFLMELVFGGASKIVCNSRFLESTLSGRYPRYKRRLTTIYNGIDIERYSSGCRQSIDGISEGEVTLLCVTSLNFENKSKGFQLVIDAFGHLQAQKKAAKLVIAALSSDPLYQKSADQYLRSKPWRDSVILLYNHQRIPNLLASADIFVYATPHNSNDSLPRALLEAQSAGLPAVTTDTTGCPEIVRDGLTGFVVPYDAHAMAEKIAVLMESPQLRSDMGKQARRWIAQTFNWDKMADQYAAMFLEIAGKRTVSAEVR